MNDFAPNKDRIGAFDSPNRPDFTSQNSYQFVWPKLHSSSGETGPLSPSTYNVQVFEGKNCEGEAFATRTQSIEEFTYTGLTTEGQIISVGVQVVDSRGYLGPILCSAPVERDNTSPEVDLQLSQASPTNANVITLSGSCSENKEWNPESHIKICIAAECSNSQHFTESVNCIDGAYQKTLSLA